MFLHEDKELFKDVIEATAESQSQTIAIVEKDYYVTMILKLLSEEVPDCVFKGGTSLSKCHHAIDRFSEEAGEIIIAIHLIISRLADIFRRACFLELKWRCLLDLYHFQL